VVIVGIALAPRMARAAAPAPGTPAPQVYPIDASGASAAVDALDLD